MDAAVTAGTRPLLAVDAGRRRLRRALLPALVFAAAAVALLTWLHFRTDAALAYVTAPVTRGAVAPSVTASGTVNPVVTVQVGTYVSGVIQELYCDFNTRVRKNQLCAKIDPRPYQTIVDQDAANLATTRAQLRKDEASLQLAKLTYERNRDLLELDSVARETVDNAYAAYEGARAQVDFDRAAIAQHRAELETARVNLGYTNILSPVDGTVVSRNVTQGQTVAASFQTPTLFVIATDLTRMQVDTNVNESDIGGVVEGNSASFGVEAFPERTFQGRVVQVRQSPQTVQNVVTYDAVVEVANTDLALKPGMTAAVRITTHRHADVLRIPAAALRYTPAALPSGAAAPPTVATRIWRLSEGRPEAITIVIGLNDDTYAEIVQGDLRASDRIITSEHAAASASSGMAPGQSITRVPRL